LGVPPLQCGEKIVFIVGPRFVSCLSPAVIAADASILAAAGSVPMSAANRFVARSYRFVTGV